jgi:PHS family inorganic phosphate transporter-like MFS transporter
MMAAVFLMQPIGQLVAWLVGYGVLIGLNNATGLSSLGKDDFKGQAHIVDNIWRIVIGVGAFPALVAIMYRLRIPESPRYTLDVAKNPDRALIDTEVYYEQRAETHLHYHDDDEMARGHDFDHAGSMDVNSDAGGADVPGSDDGAESNEPVQKPPGPFSWTVLHRVFIEERRWTYLVGTSLAWFLLDFAFYGLGIGNPRIIAKLWLDTVPSERGNFTLPSANLTGNGTFVLNTTIPSWDSESVRDDYHIFEILKWDAIQSMLTVSIGSVMGCVFLIYSINYFSRKSILAWGFVALGILMAIIGGTFIQSWGSSLHGLTLASYVMTQLVFNFGPNTLTFIIPAEIFPTQYRCTCHGISAAAGKIGSIIVQLILSYVKDSGGSLVTAPASKNLWLVLVVFAGIMVCGAIATWVFIPEVQSFRSKDSKVLPNMTLEELAKPPVQRNQIAPVSTVRRTSYPRGWINRSKAPPRMTVEMSEPLRSGEQ